ncbi:MAG: AMP-binding protein [Desulfobacteraceae bacterium]|nr:AMP-binding protein [Desulfobacteraceae bacterium]
MSKFVNISEGLKYSAEKFPYKRAVVYPAGRDKQGRVTYSQITFKQLEKGSDEIAFGLENVGITRGTRTILMVTPSIEFFYIIFAMIKIGAVPVVVDPGMGIKRMLSCLEQSKPEAFIGIEKAHVLRKLTPMYFKSIKTWVTVGKRWFWGGHTLKSIWKPRKEKYRVAKTTKNETAAIVFTTGSTGPAKGVIYTHGNFNALIEQLKDHFKVEGDEIDLPTFPLFALYDPALSMTAVIPDMDPTKPAKANPDKLIEAIENHGVTNMFASPALLHRLGKYGKKNNIKLPTLRRVISAGAPVSPANIEQFSSMLDDNAYIHTPYGATEAVSIISIKSDEILSETRDLSEKGYGLCIGRPILDTSVQIIKITDETISQLRDVHILNEGEVGEIIVQAPLVTEHYFENRKADLFGKIPDSFGKIWHRMGDVAWKDKDERIWFCGRKSHRVETKNETMFTIPCEAIFNNHEKVYRSALVGVGKKGDQIPVIFVEPFSKIKDKDKLINELSKLADSFSHTKKIKHFFIDNAFPVDIRHNAKIFREKLAVKAKKLLKI